MEKKTDQNGMQNYSIKEIDDEGERVTHLRKDFFFNAHLSIYDFAARFCKDAIVLDAGSGAGYGPAHLAKHGAREVWGIDNSTKAVNFSQSHFNASNLRFGEMDLENISGFSPNYFDVIFTSNTLEHVFNVKKFMIYAWSLLNPSGLFIAAVPPIFDENLRYQNFINPHHLNIWTPRQWYYLLGCYFEEVITVIHTNEKIGEDFIPDKLAYTTTFNDQHFRFKSCKIEDLYNQITLTAIYLATKPLLANKLLAEDTPVLFVEESFTRPPGFIDSNPRQILKSILYILTPPYNSASKITCSRLYFLWLTKKLLWFFKRKFH